MKIGKRLFSLSFCILSGLFASGLAQSNSALRGTVTLGADEDAFQKIT
jgi:hypothetical protein